MTNRKKSIYSDDYRSIIKKLVGLRRQAGLTQKTIAQQLKVSQSYISKIENCLIRIDLIQLKEFAEIYNVDLQEII